MAKKKEKPPAFQMYAKDFITGAQAMSLAERGAYATLMCQQWDKGGIRDDVAELARLLSCERAEVETVWPQVRTKFERGDDGLYRNVRIEKERKKQRTFRRKQAKNGRLGGRPKNNPGLSSGFRLAKPKPDPNHKAKKSSSSSSAIYGSGTPPTPSRVRGGRRRVNPVAWPDSHDKTQEVKRLIAEGVPRNEAIRRVG